MKLEKFDIYIGDKLYCARVVKRITQAEMAKMITDRLRENGKRRGVSQQAYAYYEKGARSMPWDVFTYACEILLLDRNAIFNEACDYLKIR